MRTDQDDALQASHAILLPLQHHGDERLDLKHLQQQQQVRKLQRSVLLFCDCSANPSKPSQTPPAQPLRDYVVVHEFQVQQNS
jgi:hypothetical protein